MSCIITNQKTILYNGSRTISFYTSRGLRQGDPLLPYLFILCMEVLSHQINKVVLQTKCTPIKISLHGPHLSHLFFVDDLVLIAQATKENSRTILRILICFCSWSEQSINNSKWKIPFSNNCNDFIHSRISNSLKIKATHSFGKYLGFPIFHKKYPTRTISNSSWIICKID